MNILNKQKQHITMNWFNKRDNETRDVSFERREAVVESVVETFKDLDKNNCRDKVFVLWMEVDDTIFLDLANITLERKLTDCLITKGFDIRNLELRKGKPKNGDPMKCKENGEIGFSMYLEAVSGITTTAPTQSKVMKARITLAPGSPGSLKQPEGYEIDSDHIPFNIGRMIEPGDPINRVNDIEIVDDTYTVSRTQAHIGFSNELGYYIQREKGDYIRTKVIRKGDTTPEHKLASEYVLFPLLDSDIIELNGYVRLLFQVID